MSIIATPSESLDTRITPDFERLPESLPLPTVAQSPTMSVEHAAQVLGLSRASTYRAARAGEIPCVFVGHRIRVLTGPLRRMLELDDDDSAF